MTNLELVVRSFRWWLKFGLAPLDGVRTADTDAAMSIFKRRAIQAVLAEIPWMVAVREWKLLYQHHLPLLSMAAMRVNATPPHPLVLGLLETQTLPKLLYLGHAWRGLPYQYLKRIANIVRMCIVCGVRIPIWMRLAWMNKGVFRWGALFFALYDTKMLRQLF